MPTIEELNALAQAVGATHDREAFAALFKHFAPRVKSYLMQSGSSERQADELAQEAMVTLWRKASQFDPVRTSISTWVFTIARHLRVDAHRRHFDRDAQAEQFDADTMAAISLPPDEQMTAERELGVREALRRLPPEHAQVVRLSFFAGQPHAQIARQLSIPPGAVPSRVRMAVAHFKRLLDGRGGPES